MTGLQAERLRREEEATQKDAATAEPQTGCSMIPNWKALVIQEYSFTETPRSFSTVGAATPMVERVR